MDNLKKPQGKNDLIITDSQQSSKMKNQKLEDESPLTINKKDNSYETKKAPMLEDMIKNNEDIQISQSENTRKNSVRRKNKVKEVENDKDNSLPKRRRGPSIKRKKRNASIRRPRKNMEAGGTIKVVGKISAKLESLIQRLGQNTNENISNTRTENKYQMGPKIKAALEKFNKKKEEESQPIPFKPAKYRSITLPDSDKGIKYDPKFQKARYIQEIVESDYEDEEYDEEYDEEEEEEEEEEDDSEDEDNNESKDKDKKSQKKNKNDVSLKKDVKNDEKANQEKKKRKKRKKKDGVLDLSHEYSSGSGDNSDIDNDKSHKKKKKTRKRRKKKENNSKSSYSEESEESEEESDETQNKEDKNRKKKGMKKKKTFNFSDSEKNEEKKKNNNNNNSNNNNNNNDEEGRFQRKLERHKSGKGIEVTKSKDGSYSVSSLSSKSIKRSNEKSKNSSFDKENLKISKDNPINIINEKKSNLEDKNGLLINKKPGKGVEYDKFSFVEYTVKNYHPKPVTIWKKQVKKYMLCKQINFSIFAQVPKKVVHKKVVMFNVNNNNDVNKKKNNNNRFGARKSVAVSINSNSLLNFAQKFDISKYEEKLSNIKKKKNNLINEKKTINTEFEKRRKRYQSILLTDDKNFNDFTKKLNQNNSNKKLNFDKITDPKKRRISVYQILQKRGLNPNFPDKSNLESKEDQTIQDLNSNKKSEINNRYNDEKSYKLEKIQEKKDDLIKETHFGVKYIVFQNKNELKTIYKKEKWKLSISKITSIFLKAIKPKEIKNKINSKVIQNNIKNSAQLEKIYKNKFDSNNNKIQKISLNYKSNKKKEIKINDISNEKEEEDESSSSRNSRSNSITQKNLINKFNETRNKKDELQKLYKKENKKPNSNEHLLLNFDLGNHYDKETKKSDKEEVKSVKSGNYINVSDDKNDFINYFSDNKFNRSNKKNYTTQVRKVNKNHDYTFDEKEKKVGKVKSKKARIKKFVSSNKDEPEPSDDERRRKGNLYDYYSGKIPNKRKQYFNYEHEKENTLNPRNKKNKRELKYENTSHHKNKSLNINSGKNRDISYRNNSTSKKQKIQKNNISHVGHNSGLITSYRHKIFEVISDKNNKNNNQTSKKNNQNFLNKSMSALRRKNEFKIKLNSSMEMIKIDAIKSKMKKRLIEIDNKLIDAVNYYNGPIDISCISLKNYTQTVKDLNKRALKNGYKCSKCETNYYELTNGFKSFFVEIVKIRDNMLYYLIVKNQ